MSKSKMLIWFIIVAVIAVGVGASVGLSHRHHRPPVQPTEPTSQVEPMGTEDPTLGTEHQPTEDVTEPTGTEPTEPDASEPTGGKEEPTEPVGTEPTGPDATEPMGTEPSEPKETEPEETEPEPTEHVHNYEHVKEEKKPTCTEPGYTDIACECGHFRTVGYEALGHDWSEWVITVEPTVESAGERQRTCSHCGTVTETVPKLDPETGEAYEHYIDPRIQVKVNRSNTRYRYGSVSVLDTRSWGDPPSIWINEDGSLKVVYFQKDGSRVEVVVEVPAPEYNHCCVIMDDGSYVLRLTGDYGG